FSGILAQENITISRGVKKTSLVTGKEVVGSGIVRQACKMAKKTIVGACSNIKPCPLPEKNIVRCRLDLPRKNIIGFKYKRLIVGSPYEIYITIGSRISANAPGKAGHISPCYQLAPFTSVPIIKTFPVRQRRVGIIDKQ